MRTVAGLALIVVAVAVVASFLWYNFGGQGAALFAGCLAVGVMIGAGLNLLLSR